MCVRNVQEEKWGVKMPRSGTNYMDREAVAEVNEDMLFADGFDDALVGYIDINRGDGKAARTKAEV